MRALLIAFFTIIPLVELALLIRIGQRIGTLQTVAVVVLTALLGAHLVRREGVSMARRAVQELAAGRIPAATLLEGVLVLLGAALLITPGVITDIIGLALVIPPSRRFVLKLGWWYLEYRLSRGVRRR